MRSGSRGPRSGSCVRFVVPAGRPGLPPPGGRTGIGPETVWRKRIRLIGSTLRSRIREEKSRVIACFAWGTLPALRIGKTHFLHPRRLPHWRGGSAAHGVLRRTENTGKVLLTFRGSRILRFRSDGYSGPATSSRQFLPARRGLAPEAGERLRAIFGRRQNMGQGVTSRWRAERHSRPGFEIGIDMRYINVS